MTLKTLILATGLALGYGMAAASAENITLTTYYPSPSGSYALLQSNRLAIGDTDGDGSLTSADQPNRDGDLRLKAQAGNPASWPTGTQGQVAYAAFDDKLYYSNGSAWVGSGSSTAVIYLSCGWGPTYNWISSCTPPSCPSGWTLAGISNEPTTSYGNPYYIDGQVFGKTTNVCTK